MKRYFEIVLGHRALVAALVALLTVAAGWSASRGIVATSVGGLFLGDSPHYDRYLELSEAFGNDEVIIVGLDAPDLARPEFARSLRSVADSLAAMEEVASVSTLLDAPLLRNAEEGLAAPTVEALAPEGWTDPLLAELRDDPLVGGLLLSRQEDAVTVVVELTADPERAAEASPAIAADVRAAFEAAGFEPEAVHMGGMIATFSEVLNQSYHALGTIFPWSAALLLLTVWLMFRRLWPAALAIGISMLSAVWTMGFAIYFDRNINILMAMVPAIVLIVAFSDVVHLCSAYLLELEAGRSKREAILESAVDVGRACLWTSATTFVGFVSLSMIPTPIFRHLGVVLGFGVAAALLLAMTLSPLLFSLMPRPKPLREGATSRVQSAIDRALDGMRRLAAHHPIPVLVAFALITLASAYGLSQLRVETDMVERLADDNPTRLDADWFSERFAGTRSVDLYLTASEPGGALEPAFLAAIGRLQRRLVAETDATASFALPDLLDRVHETLNDEGTPPPDHRRKVAEYLLLFELGGGGSLDRLIDFDRTTLHLSIRLDELGYRAASATGVAGVKIATDELGELGTAEASGLVYLLGGWLDEIVAGQRRGLLLSAVLIGLMMIVALRSVHVGLLSMGPNLLPLLVLGGWVGGMWDAVDSDTLILAIMAIGIGVDDTIHFLVRYRIEARRTGSVDEALERTFAFAGRAIVMTTVILIVGFAPFILSDYLTTHMFGTLLPLCLTVALVADLLLVPALVRVGVLDFGTPGASPKG